MSFTAIPLRKKYYDGEQVIEAVGKSGADYETMMSIFKALSEMESAEKDYEQGFIDGARYAINEANRKIIEALDKAFVEEFSGRRDTECEN